MALLCSRGEKWSPSCSDDNRHMGSRHRLHASKGPIDGKVDETSSKYLSGFFDRGSFQGTLSGWAQTVFVGRAHLGSIPIGIIAIETRTIEHIVPTIRSIVHPSSSASWRLG